MADDKKQLSEARELVDLNVKEVSLVDRAAIQRTFLVTKRSESGMSAKPEETEEQPAEEPKVEETEEQPAEEPAAEETEEQPAEEPAAEEPADGEDGEEDEEPPAEEESADTPTFEDIEKAVEALHAIAEKFTAAEKSEVEKSRRFTQSRRDQLVGLIETAEGLLKDFEGEPSKVEGEEVAKSEGQPVSPEVMIETLAKRTAELVLSKIEPRLEKTEKRVESVEKTVPAPRSAHPEPNGETPVEKGGEVPTEVLFKGIFGQ